MYRENILIQKKILTVIKIIIMNIIPIYHLLPYLPLKTKQQLIYIPYLTLAVLL
jgi:hypothetical protein